MRDFSDSLGPDELAPLLLRLSPGEPEMEIPLQTTVADVAEATGLREEEIRSALREMRRARLSEELRLLEEPLFRVERPGFAPPADARDYLARERTLSTLLDRAPTVAPVRPTTEPARGERWITYALLAPVVGALAYFLLRAILAA